MTASCINMPDNINTAMINSVKETIKSSTIWNKLVKTIENANINMDKLIQDSVEYGIEIGMFHQNKDGKIECKDAKRISNTQTNDKFISPLQQKNNRIEEPPQITTRSAPKSDSETTLSAYSSSKSIVTRTRKTNLDKELKRSADISSESNVKRLKSDTVNSNFIESPKTKPIEQKNVKKTKPINKKMVLPIPICAFCLGDEALNKRTKVQEDMISCWDCGTCAHPTCLQWPDSLFQKVRTIRWQCLQCKRCTYCGMISKKDDDMLLCDVCDQGFHIYCCDPPIKVPPKGEWVCRICRPSICRKEKPSIFLSENYEFVADCQIITPETVRKICNLSPKVLQIHTTKSTKNNIKIKSTLARKATKINLLQLKKKKLVNKAVQRQRQALTDGLSKFFTPSNKRQSRVSKQSISSDSLFEKDRKRSPSLMSPKDKSSNRSIVSSSRSKSPITVDIMDESGNSQDTAKTKSEKKRTPNKKLPEISVYHSPKRNQHDVDLKLQDKMKSNLKKCKLKQVPIAEKQSDSEIIKIRGPGRPKKFDKTISILDTSVSVTESSSITMSKNDLSTNYSVLSVDNCEVDPYPISDIDRMWYTDIQQKVVELLPPPVDAAPQLQPLNKLVTTCHGRNEHNEPPELSMETGQTLDGDHLSHSSNIDGSSGQRFPPRIQIGRYIIDTWYSAPYPSEYARLNVLYICEYCLKPIKSYDVYVMHMEKCTSNFPPGNEIYRNGDLSVFEVDGYVSKLYCQQLCLLAKLFLDHKTLYYDVEPFLFYVAVISKNKSSHIIGYFSKEKRSTHKYNLSCIMVLPPYQKFNYGRFLIDFSYLLSRKEGQCGSPEKPLSTLGRISYESYWKSKILPFILNTDDVSVDFYARQKIYKPSKGLAVTIDRISTETGISPHDVASTIQLLSKKVDLDNSDRISIQFDWEKLKCEAEKYAGRYPKWIPIDEECLRWAPLINPNEKLNSGIRSPQHIMSSPKENVPKQEIDKSKPRKNAKEDNKIQNVAVPISTADDNPVSPPINSIKAEITKTPKKKKEPPKTNQSPKYTPKIKSTNKMKPAVIDIKPSAVINQIKSAKKKQPAEKRDQIVTRNRSNIMNNSISSKNEEISPIKVDLTKESSENSDIQDNDDCIEISSPISSIRNNKAWNVKKPIFEIIKDSLASQIKPLSLSPPKESPPINRNDPSPVSTVQNEIIGPILLSPEIDEDNEEENEIEKWDTKVEEDNTVTTDAIELSNDSVMELQEQNENKQQVEERNVFIAMEDQGDRAIEVVIEEDNLHCGYSSPSIDHKQALLSSSNSEEDSVESTNSLCSNEPSKTNVFISPATVKESPPIVDDCDKPPTLSRISSQEDNSSNHLDDSSTSFTLPADISQNEEFKNFYNDGNVFNSITTSQTDSSDKDADESLLSVSNSNSYGMSDVELNGAYSCDSSICYNLRPRLRSSKFDEEFFESPLRCSPGQSDLVQNQVSSTTPFVSPLINDININSKNNNNNINNNNNNIHSHVNNDVTFDSMKCEITFEDINISNSDDKPMTTSRNCRYSDCPRMDNESIADNHKDEIMKLDNNDKEVDILKDMEISKGAESQPVEIDIVSSSLNETSIISDSSL